MKKILIVEDELDIQELLGAYLRDAGYQTAAAGDGVEALALFGSQPFDLVLLDVMLPKIDGFGVCELAVGVRLLRRRADCGQPYQKSAPQAGPRLHRDGERGGLPCCEGNSLRA